MSTVNSATSTPTTSGASTSGNTNVTGLGTDFTTFLTLLTTQLKNQDPLSPLDTNQFTQQLVSFSQVEQEINANTKLQSLLTLQQQDQSINALPLVGHVVQYADNQEALINGQGTFAYNLPNDAASATITITDPSGKVVLQTPAETAAGSHTFNWDGKGLDGAQVPDGVYTFNVSATAHDKSAITAAISAFGKVDGVSSTNGSTTVDIGGVTETLGNIVAITS
jgi:flagellar basal-body rod modification protein FlgD